MLYSSFCFCIQQAYNLNFSYNEVEFIAAEIRFFDTLRGQIRRNAQHSVYSFIIPAQFELKLY